MPTNTEVLGFSNRWYAPAMRCSWRHLLDGDLSINVVAAPYFIATKLEAFHGRGGGDYIASHDLEDLITVVDGRPSLHDEVLAAEPELRTYLADELAVLLETAAFVDALPGHMPVDAMSQARVSIVERRLHRLAGG